MAERVDLYGTYKVFTEHVHDAIRKETFGVDLGQNSWLTVDEHERFATWLQLRPEHHVLEIASGSGGPALHLAKLTGCRVTGVDVDEGGIATATRAAADAGQADRVTFAVADASQPLPFDDNSFDAVLCIDSMNHLADRVRVLREWRRVLRPGRRAMYTDPVLITGPVTNDELALRSSIGFFLFLPPGVNERMIAEAGFDLVSQEDVTENAARISGRWHDARQRHRDALIPIEGEARFDGLQKFFASVHLLTKERRLSRFAYLLEKPAS